MTAHWEHFAHQADIGVRGFGADMAEAFAQTALALTAVMCDPTQIRPVEPVTVVCDADDPEILLVDWLNSIVYEMATRNMLFAAFEVKIEGRQLSARMRGEPVDVARHQPAVEIKGATFTELKVRKQPDGWMAQCVLDV